MGFTLRLFRMVAPIAILVGTGWAQTSIVMGRSSTAATFTGGGQITFASLKGSGFLDSENDNLLGFAGNYTLQGGNLQYNRVTGLVSSPTPTLFTYTVTDGTGTLDTLTANIHWSLITTDSHTPVLTGVMTDLVTTGSSDFIAAFASQSTVNFQVAFLGLTCPGSPNPGTCTLSDLVGANQATAKANSANTLPDPTPAPEPASLALLGSGLMVVGGTIRRRLKK